MNSIVKSLRALTTKLGGTDTTSKTVVDALKKVFGAYGGTGSTAKTISGAIDEITTVAVATPSGKLTITGTSEVNCSTYATAQVSDADLVAENIKKDVNILGVTGSYEGGGGSSDFSTAELTIIVDSNPNNYGAMIYGSFETDTDGVFVEESFSIVPTYSEYTAKFVVKESLSIELSSDDGTVSIESSSGSITVGDSVILTGDATIHISIS